MWSARETTNMQVNIAQTYRKNTKKTNLKKVIRAQAMHQRIKVTTILKKMDD
jgi:hypothetical protein